MSGQDIGDLFNAIAEKILFIKPFEAKKRFLNIKGNNSVIANHKPTLLDLATLIEAYDIKCEIKVSYVDGEVKAAIELPDPPKEEPVKAAMKEQVKEVKVPVKIEEPEAKKPQAPNSLDIPDFNA